jgi:hypothetical protein
MSKGNKSKADNVRSNKDLFADSSLVKEPPRALGETLFRLGPGMIVDQAGVLSFTVTSIVLCCCSLKTATDSTLLNSCHFAL